MKSVTFDGVKFALQKKSALKKLLDAKSASLYLTSIVHKEDKTGLTYTKLKEQTAELLNIKFERVTVSFSDNFEDVKEIIKSISNNSDVNGLLIQKPSRLTWEKNYKENLSFFDWWEELTSQIDPKKDVDCLTRVNLDEVYGDKSDFLPATAQAVVDILKNALGKNTVGNDFGGLTVSIVGKSELVGKPLAAKLSFWGAKVYLLGSKNNLQEFLPRSDVIISATGVQKLITNNLVSQNSIVIDVGEPYPDVDYEKVLEKTSFITPVPGGVGPVTVVTLFQNLISLTF